MPFILYISKVNPPSDDLVQHVIANHQTPQDDITINYVDEKLKNGFTITRVDRPIEIRKEPDIKDYLKIKEYKFPVRITAKENEAKNKEQSDNRNTRAGNNPAK